MAGPFDPMAVGRITPADRSSFSGYDNHAAPLELSSVPPV
ncbi:MAG: hypothetical protein HJJLKODD_00805 [Phycisphaerae bacterium]|nr:hypothetical protein [Phycisphaerae bacterium]